jgi:molybdopterin/thiamine biosynthesis adenylyltransferase
MPSGRKFSVAMPEGLSQSLQAHLIRPDRQEDLAFALYRPSKGATRDSALLIEAIFPTDGDRVVHGNVSFLPDYYVRSIAKARQMGLGLALIHSHPRGRGWQTLSSDDERAERSIAASTLAATKQPLVGMTLAAQDLSYSSRIWMREEHTLFRTQEAKNVRVVGRRLRVSSPRVTGRPMRAFDRSELAWGRAGRETLADLTIGVVGLGSVGSAVAEILVRLGVKSLLFVDPDVVDVVNLDRTLNTTASTVGWDKVEVAAEAALAHAPGPIHVTALAGKCDDAAAYSALLDCDIVFACVDRPWGRRVLNQLAYTNAIPVSNGGMLARSRKGKFVGADWHVHVVGPGRRCLQCWNAFRPEDAAVDFAGLLDDPHYIKELDERSPLIAHANVIPFSMCVAAMQIMQTAALVLGPIHDTGDWNFHAATGHSDVTADTLCENQCPYEAMSLESSLFPPLKPTVYHYDRRATTILSAFTRLARSFSNGASRVAKLMERLLDH